MNISGDIGILKLLNHVEYSWNFFVIEWPPQVNRLSEEIEQMERDQQMLKKGIEVAEKRIENGTDKLGEIMKKKQINGDKLLSSQSKSSMGVKIKSELANELKDLESKLDKKKKEIV